MKHAPVLYLTMLIALQCHALGPLQKVQNNHWPGTVEKVHLHLDRSVVSQGEDIWYSIYVVQGSDLHFSNVTGTVHVDLISPENEIVVSQTHRLTQGRGSGSMGVPNDLRTGSFQLRAYTNGMRNHGNDFFFTRTINIVGPGSVDSHIESTASRLDIQFFPEGGYLVNGLGSQVAFKAMYANGQDAEITGTVVDSDGRVISDLKTLSRGTGAFYLKPRPNKEYVALLGDGYKFTIPQALGEGYVMTVDGQDPENINVEVQATDSYRNDPFQIIGSMCGERYFESSFSMEGKNSLNFQIPKADLPSGTMVLTLLDNSSRPRCERPVFVNGHRTLAVTAKMAPKNIGKRERIELDISIRDERGRPVRTAFSIAVTDMGQVGKSQHSQNIRTQLLLQSNIKGHIRQPAKLFRDQTRATLYELDLVMLTHGWRRYSWLDPKAKEPTEPDTPYPSGLTVSGTAKSKKGAPLANTTLQIVSRNRDETTLYSTVTDGSGRFRIQDFDQIGPTEITFNAFNGKKEPRDVAIVLDENKVVPPPSNFKAPKFSGTDRAQEPYSEFLRSRSRVDSLYGFDQAIELDETVVKAKKLEKRKPQSPSTYNITPDQVIYADEYSNGRVLQLVRKLSGVRVTPNDMVSIRGGGGPLWVIDGIAVSNDNGTTGGGFMGPEPVPGIVGSLDYNSIERVEILKGVSSSNFGVRAGHNGVILIYTKKGVSSSPSSLSPTFTVSGHSETKEFYSPVYTVEQENHSKPDYRSTLYWNPSMKTDEAGKATVILFNSDVAKQIQVQIESLSTNGVPGALLHAFGNKEDY